MSKERRYESNDSREMEKGSMGGRLRSGLLLRLRADEEELAERREKKDFFSGGLGYSSISFISKSDCGVWWCDDEVRWWHGRLGILERTGK